YRFSSTEPSKQVSEVREAAWEALHYMPIDLLKDEPALEVLASYGNTGAAHQLHEMARVGLDGAPRSVEELRVLACQGKLGAVSVLDLATKNKELVPQAIIAMDKIVKYYNPRAQSGYPPPRIAAMAARQVLEDLKEAPIGNGPLADEARRIYNFYHQN